MKSKLRVGDYIALKENEKGDNGERYEVISIEKDKIKVLNLKNSWEVTEMSWDDLVNKFCGAETIRSKSQSIENVIKKVQNNIQKDVHQNVKIDLGNIEAIIFPIYQNLLKLIVFERRTWSGDIKTNSYELPDEVNALKEEYPMLSNNIWDFSDRNQEAS